MPGDFTTRFDKEILRSKMAELDEVKKKAAKEEEELQEIERSLNEVSQILEKRSGFLRERFPNSVTEEVGGAGFKLVFAPSGANARAATFSLRARVNESRLAILVESNCEIPDLGVKEYDYVGIPLKNWKIERGKQFIESKLLDFARNYTR